jgi:hypothetical protein
MIECTYKTEDSKTNKFNKLSIWFAEIGKRYPISHGQVKVKLHEKTIIPRNFKNIQMGNIPIIFL